MSDLVDDAQVLEEAERDDALARIRRRVTHGDWRDLSAAECVECSEPIPDQRREAVPGVQTCVDCAQALEREQLRQARGW